MKDESNWEHLSLAAKVLKPLASALECGQSQGRGLGKVRSAFFRLELHFNQFAYPPSATLLNRHILQRNHARKQYTLRPMHTLAYILDPRCGDSSARPATSEISSAFDLIVKLAEAHDIKLTLAKSGMLDEANLPDDYARATAERIVGDYTAFKAKTAGSLVLPTVCKESTVGDPLV